METSFTPPRTAASSFWRVYNAFTNGRSLLGCLMSIASGAWPVALWMYSFKSASVIPVSWRPQINTNLLPRWNAFLLSPLSVLGLTLAVSPVSYYLMNKAEDTNATHYPLTPKTIGKLRLAAFVLFLYPTSLSVIDWLAGGDISVLRDLYAFLFYGVLHFAMPFLGGFIFWLWAPSGVAEAYGWTLGFTNFACLCTHILFPNAAPWWYTSGEVTPSYETSLGNPAGLIRIDDILGINIYRRAFKYSPVVFGALPSVHGSSAVVLALFAIRYWNGIPSVLAVLYTASMFHSTIYLQHHYAIDLLAGSFYALAVFLIIRRFKLCHLEAKAEETESSNGWERLIYGSGRIKDPALPLAQYHRLSTIIEEDLKSPAAVPPHLKHYAP